MTTKMTMILAGACLALAGCGGGGGGVPVAGEAEVVLDPFGNPSEIQGLAAFFVDDASAVAAQDAITVTFVDADSFTVTLPNGDVLTFLVADEVELAEDIFQFTNADGDVLELIELVDDAGDAIVFVARVDQLGAGDGFEVYGAIGIETDEVNLPAGGANYAGAFVASITTEGALITDEFVGVTNVSLNFDGDSVDVTMAGSFDFADVTFNGAITALGLTVAGAQYSGTFDAAVDLPQAAFGLNFDNLIIYDEPIVGAFFGADGDFTAGAFAGEDIFFDDEPETIQPVEMVGAYAAEIVEVAP